MRGDKRERILRVLLNSKEALSKNELSKRANCTRQWVILFSKELERKKLVKDTMPVNMEKLIDYWISIARKPKKFRSYMVKGPLDLLKKSTLGYALTTYQAENIVQHYLFLSRIDIYTKEENLNSWHNLMTKNGLYGKGNVRVIAADPHVMYQKKDYRWTFDCIYTSDYSGFDYRGRFLPRSSRNADEEIVMYKEFETRTSYKYQKEVINNLQEPIYILGGWAVFFHVNKRFQEAQGRPYLGSRDIDLGFQMIANLKETTGCSNRT